MDFHKLWGVISKSVTAGIAGILLGVLATYIIFDSVVLPGKNTEIASLNAVVKVEKGRQEVLEERVKLLGDKAVFLEDRLKFKPEIEKEKQEKLNKELDILRNENVQLTNIKQKLEQIEGKEIEKAKIEVKLEQKLKIIDKLEAELAKYSSEVIIENYRIREGESWIGFGGKASLGLSKVDNDFDKGNFAHTVSSIFDNETKTIFSGQQFHFNITDKKYSLVISNVQYIGGYIEISVFNDN